MTINTLILKLSHIKRKERTTGSMYDCFTYMVEYASKYQFPKPTFIDLIKFEEDDSMEDAFVLHYKNASNGNA